MVQYSSESKAGPGKGIISYYMSYTAPFLRDSLQVIYSVLMDGEEIHSVENKNPRSFENVKVFAGDDFRDPVDGGYRNLVWENLLEYPKLLTIKDDTGNYSELVGVYERQGDSHVWKYGEFEFAFTGKY